MLTVVENPSEESWDEDRHHRHWSAEPRKLGSEAQIGLVRSVGLHGDIGRLQPGELFELPRDRLIPHQAVAEDDRLARKDHRRTIEVGLLPGPSDPIAMRIDRVEDSPSGPGEGVTGA